MHPIATLVSFVGLLAVAAPATAQEAMNRAQRDADNPLRIIIEASKIKSRAKVEEAPVTKPAAVRPALVVDRTPRAAVADGAVLVRKAEAAERTDMATVAANPLTIPVPSTTAAPDEARPVSAIAATAAERLPLPLPPPVIPVAPPAALRLAQMIEPVTPRALIGKLRGDVEVTVGFMVQADGSVADAAIRSTTHRQMDSAVLQAVRQWRYEPIGETRSHAVQLVLRQND
jgi:TonB family protein